MEGPGAGCAGPSPQSDADSSAPISQNGYKQRRRWYAYSMSVPSYLFLAVACVLLCSACPLQALRTRCWRRSPHCWTFVGAPHQPMPPWPAGRGPGELRASKVDDILAELKTLTLLETSELVKKIEEAFGVSASMAVSAAPAAAGAPAMATAPEDEEDDEDKPKKTSFEVVLLERPEEQSVRMALFRILRKVLPDQPLTEVKAVIDNAPTTLKVVNKEEDAKEAVKLIEGAGGKAEIR
ncbi:RIBOSOMAL PROTEIN L7/L12, putative [Babesia bigemina]|uniref:RIBOSOMAL PROTEIN L7/L12, putative n=1 Tax=Babesia bigemina TaxID=5866 RepID=A0A061DDV9_BABBI|nr:RIBOSOMAL PROTEIN L7/L12, putative [Babesia bigemina]CDR96620.1 RIBOSOMAL PROTEIN L7/L12, putative [Babesia bigemina]|eukprot:XP_012768806.1 RIBOSOMAL PROTEIN L7/L12, putative [Babesia bigemina]